MIQEVTQKIYDTLPEPTLLECYHIQTEDIIVWFLGYTILIIGQLNKYKDKLDEQNIKFVAKDYWNREWDNKLYAFVCSLAAFLVGTYQFHNDWNLLYSFVAGFAGTILVEKIVNNILKKI